MNRSHSILPALAAAIVGIASQSVLAQTTVFSDTFGNGSTVQTTATAPTANSTTYQWFQQGASPTTPTIAAGDLHLAGRATSSVLVEAQALFTTSPVTLQNVGDSLNLTISFNNTQNIFPSASLSTINVGLYNSHQVLPNSGVNMSAGTTSGGSQGWNGYAGRISGATGGNASEIFTRSPQAVNGTTSQNQDLLFNGTSGTGSYNSPAGAVIATSGGVFAGLTQGSTYTLSYTITLSAANTLTINNNLFDSLNNLLFSQVGTLNSLTNEMSYDAMAFGWRYNSATAASSVDVNSITVTENLGSVPEPTVAALALTGVGLFFVRRFRR